MNPYDPLSEGGQAAAWGRGQPATAAAQFGLGRDPRRGATAFKRKPREDEGEEGAQDNVFQQMLVVSVEKSLLACASSFGPRALIMLSFSF